MCMIRFYHIMRGSSKHNFWYCTDYVLMFTIAIIHGIPRWNNSVLRCTVLLPIHTNMIHEWQPSLHALENRVIMNPVSSIFLTMNNIKYLKVTTKRCITYLYNKINFTLPAIAHHCYKFVLYFLKGMIFVAPLQNIY